MIKSFEIKNFKCFGANPSAVVECAPITLIYGPNNGGKSAISQALRLMKLQFGNSSVGGNPFTHGETLRHEWLTSFEKLCHKGRGIGGEMQFTCSFHSSKGKASSSGVADAFVRLSYELQAGNLKSIQFGKGADVEYVGRYPHKLDGLEDGNIVQKTFTTGPKNIGAYKLWKADQSCRDELEKWGKACQNTFGHKLHHIPAVRSGAFSAERKWMNDSIISAFTEEGRPDWHKYLSDEPIRSRVNGWLQKFDVGVTVKARMNGWVDVSLRHYDDEPVGLPDVGFGVGQILPVITYAEALSDATILIEEPESNLHPRVQAMLGDLFAETSEKRNNQYLIETHSELLVLRLQRRIRDRLTAATSVSVPYVIPRSGFSEIMHLAIDGNGFFIDEWPNGFFEDQYKELYG